MRARFSARAYPAALSRTADSEIYPCLRINLQDAPRILGKPEPRRSCGGARPLHEGTLGDVTLRLSETFRRIPGCPFTRSFPTRNRTSGDVATFFCQARLKTCWERWPQLMNTLTQTGFRRRSYHGTEAPPVVFLVMRASTFQRTARENFHGSWSRSSRAPTLPPAPWTPSRQAGLNHQRSQLACREWVQSSGTLMIIIIFSPFQSVGIGGVAYFPCGIAVQLRCGAIHPPREGCLLFTRTYFTPTIYVQ